MIQISTICGLALINPSLVALVEPISADEQERYPKDGRTKIYVGGTKVNTQLTVDEVYRLLHSLSPRS
jgi:hypothetical protein